MKLSEILKKIQQGELNISKEEIKPQDNLQKETEVKPPIELKELSVDKVYGDAISSVRWLFNELLSGKKKIGIDNILSVISDSVELFKTKTQELLLYSCYSTPDSYIYA
ncbi:MAG: hypothetical protein N2Z73_00510, partial [Endomicrobia bacterium]|nr:hypothetical protein [Endomicrobiia bacterium]